MVHVHGGSSGKGMAWSEVLDQYPGIQFTKVSPSSGGTGSDKPTVLKAGGGKVVITADQSKVARLKTPKTAKIRVPCLYCKVMLSGADKLKPHIKSKHPGKRVPKLSVEKVSSKKASSEEELNRRNVIKLQDPWQILWGTKDLVYVKFNFRKPSDGRRRRARSDSDISVEMESESTERPGGVKIQRFICHRSRVTRHEEIV